MSLSVKPLMGWVAWCVKYIAKMPPMLVPNSSMRGTGWPSGISTSRMKCAKSSMYTCMV